MRWSQLARGPEADRIRAFAEAVGGPAPPGGTRLPAGDDAAAFDLPDGEATVLSTDAFAEGVHFRREWVGWGDVGHHCAAAALSDLAACAARPVGVLVSLLLPPELDTSVLSAMGRGMGECLEEAGAALLGGDLSSSESGVVLDIAAAGGAEEPVSRAGAEPGDELWVTGELGGAAAAVADWSRGLEPEPAARRAFARPTPRLAEARWLAERGAVRAMIDLSDGLATDVRHLAAASGAGAELEREALPLAGPLRNYSERSQAVRMALGGGEDYELLFAAPSGAVGHLRPEFEELHGVGLTRVGAVRRERGVSLRQPGGEVRPLAETGFDHFDG